MALKFLFMRGSRNFCNRSGGGRGGGGGVQARLPVNSSDNVLILFSPQLILQFNRGCNFPRFQRGPTFFRGHLFPGV